MKEDRDANYIAQNAEGVTLTAGSPPGCCVLPRRVTKPAFNAKILPRAGYARGRQPGAF